MYLLDENLNPNIAGALRKFDWDIRTVMEVFQREGVPDDEIIDWLSKTTAVWIKQPKLGLSGWDQFKLVVRAIDRIHEKIKSSHGAVHFCLSKRGGPTVTWEAKH